MTRDYKALSKYFSVPIAGLPVRAKPDPAVLAARGRSGAAMKKVKALLAKHPAIDVQKDRGDYWVSCEGFDPDSEDDPLYENHFAVGGEEVLEAVLVYVEALEARAPKA